ncbi:hypothetical protein CTAYLR_002889 [Chrysophaeum taylorii]|uniref:Uncharacterized protein n=1 Tax=Chrysophaeum taylorii TaxID=2483200 RepID=A0AAD7UM23_9STRA|nr:hypothetical protein CTAYLR_002889 [Chrysophaeum taylorii]
MACRHGRESVSRRRVRVRPKRLIRGGGGGEEVFEVEDGESYDEFVIRACGRFGIPFQEGVSLFTHSGYRYDGGSFKEIEFALLGRSEEEVEGIVRQEVDSAPASGVLYDRVQFIDGRKQGFLSHIEFVSNSIRAVKGTASKTIKICHVYARGEFSYFVFLDHGAGMTPETLTRWSKLADRDEKVFGKAVDREGEETLGIDSFADGELGFFGRGGKAAGFSAGESICAVSRPQKSDMVHFMRVDKKRAMEREARGEEWSRNEILSWSKREPEKVLDRFEKCPPALKGLLARELAENPPDSFACFVVGDSIYEGVRREMALSPNDVRPFLLAAEEVSRNFAVYLEPEYNCLKFTPEIVCELCFEQKEPFRVYLNNTNNNVDDADSVYETGRVCGGGGGGGALNRRREVRLDPLRSLTRQLRKISRRDTAAPWFDFSFQFQKNGRVHDLGTIHARLFFLPWRQGRELTCWSDGEEMPIRTAWTKFSSTGGLERRFQCYWKGQLLYDYAVDTLEFIKQHEKKSKQRLSSIAGILQFGANAHVDPLKSKFGEGVTKLLAGEDPDASIAVSDHSKWSHVYFFPAASLEQGKKKTSSSFSSSSEDKIKSSRIGPSFSRWLKEVSRAYDESVVLSGRESTTTFRTASLGHRRYSVGDRVVVKEKVRLSSNEGRRGDSMISFVAKISAILPPDDETTENNNSCFRNCVMHVEREPATLFRDTNNRAVSIFKIDPLADAKKAIDKILERAPSRLRVVARFEEEEEEDEVQTPPRREKGSSAKSPPERPPRRRRRRRRKDSTAEEEEEEDGIASLRWKAGQTRASLEVSILDGDANRMLGWCFRPQQVTAFNPVLTVGEKEFPWRPYALANGCQDPTEQAAVFGYSSRWIEERVLEGGKVGTYELAFGLRGDVWSTPPHGVAPKKVKIECVPGDPREIRDAYFVLNGRRVEEARRGDAISLKYVWVDECGNPTTQDGRRVALRPRSWLVGVSPNGQMNLRIPKKKGEDGVVLSSSSGEVRVPLRILPPKAAGFCLLESTPPAEMENRTEVDLVLQLVDAEGEPVERDDELSRYVVVTADSCLGSELELGLDDEGIARGRFRVDLANPSAGSKKIAVRVACFSAARAASFSETLFEVNVIPSTRPRRIALDDDDGDDLGLNNHHHHHLLPMVLEIPAASTKELRVRRLDDAGRDVVASTTATITATRDEEEPVVIARDEKLIVEAPQTGTAVYEISDSETGSKLALEVRATALAHAAWRVEKGPNVYVCNTPLDAHGLFAVPIDEFGNAATALAAPRLKILVAEEGDDDDDDSCFFSTTTTTGILNEKPRLIELVWSPGDESFTTTASIVGPKGRVHLELLGENEKLEYKMREGVLDARTELTLSRSVDARGLYKSVVVRAADLGGNILAVSPRDAFVRLIKTGEGAFYDDASGGGLLPEVRGSRWNRSERGFELDDFWVWGPYGDTFSAKAELVRSTDRRSLSVADRRRRCVQEEEVVCSSDVVPAFAMMDTPAPVELKVVVLTGVVVVAGMAVQRFRVLEVDEAREEAPCAPRERNITVTSPPSCVEVRARVADDGVVEVGEVLDDGSSSSSLGPLRVAGSYDVAVSSDGRGPAAEPLEVSHSFEVVPSRASHLAVLAKNSRNSFEKSLELPCVLVDDDLERFEVEQFEVLGCDEFGNPARDTGLDLDATLAISSKDEPNLGVSWELGTSSGTLRRGVPSKQRVLSSDDGKWRGKLFVVRASNNDKDSELVVEGVAELTVAFRLRDSEDDDYSAAAEVRFKVCDPRSRVWRRVALEEELSAERRELKKMEQAAERTRKDIDRVVKWVGDHKERLRELAPDCCCVEDDDDHNSLEANGRRVKTKLVDLDRRAGPTRADEWRRDQRLNNNQDAVVGFVKELFVVENDRLADLLSWHLGDRVLETLVTKTSKAATDLMNRRYQTKPVDRYRGSSDNLDTPPHARLRRYGEAASLIWARAFRASDRVFSLDPAADRVRDALFGSIVFFENINDATAYDTIFEKQKSSHNLTLLTLDGERIKADGSRGGPCGSFARATNRAIFRKKIPLDHPKSTYAKLGEWLDGLDEPIKIKALDYSFPLVEAPARVAAACRDLRQIDDNVDLAKQRARTLKTKITHLAADIDRIRSGKTNDDKDASAKRRRTEEEDDYSRPERGLRRRKHH